MNALQKTNQGINLTLPEMKIAYSPSADQLRKKLLRRYYAIDTYFTELEKHIRHSPYNVVYEKPIIEGRPVNARNRKVKTGVSNGNYNVSYLDLSVFYTIDEPKKQIVILGVYVE